MALPRGFGGANNRPAHQDMGGFEDMFARAQTRHGKSGLLKASLLLLRQKFPPTNVRPQPQNFPTPHTSPTYHAPASSRSESSYSAETTVPLRPLGSYELGISDMSQYLSKYDTIFLVDDSGSMEPLWDEARAALSSIANLAVQYDTDGVELQFLNNPWRGSGLTTREEVDLIFKGIQPRGPTPTGRKLKEIFDLHIPRLLREGRSAKPVNIVVITDGVPTIDPEDAIVEAAHKLDENDLPPHILGIQFVQIGDDPDAAEALIHLDDNLSKRYQIRDMVDTTPCFSDGEGLTHTRLIKILLGGIHRRVDRNANL